MEIVAALQVLEAYRLATALAMETVLLRLQVWVVLRLGQLASSN